MHLWEFLLELLADNQRRSLIAWTRREKGEFKIIKTEEVAKLWGFENGRQGMTYDKLSRALRQYYTDGIIAKVSSRNLDAPCGIEFYQNCVLSTAMYAFFPSKGYLQIKIKGATVLPFRG